MKTVSRAFLLFEVLVALALATLVATSFTRLQSLIAAQYQQVCQKGEVLSVVRSHIERERAQGFEKKHNLFSSERGENSSGMYYVEQIPVQTAQLPLKLVRGHKHGLSNAPLLTILTL